MTDTNDTNPPAARPKRTPPEGGRTFDADRARAAQAAGVEAQRARRERLAELERERGHLDRALARQAEQIATLQAAAIEHRAAEKAARAEAAALRRKVEQMTAAAHSKAKRTPAAPAPSVDLVELVEGASSVAVRTLSAVLRSLATASRTGELWRSGADAAALLDGVTRAAVAVQALADRAAAAPVRRASRPAAIEAGAVDIAALAESIRARAALPVLSTSSSRDDASPVSVAHLDGAQVPNVEQRQDVEHAPTE